MTNTVSNAKAILQAAAMAGTTIAVYAPDYVNLALSATITLRDGFSRKQTAADLKALLVNYFSYYNRSFAETITVSDVIIALSGHPAVRASDVTAFYRKDQFSSGIHTPVGDPSTIFNLISTGATVSGGNTVTSTDLVLTFSGGIADLT
jgi:hypothetical protein